MGGVAVCELAVVAYQARGERRRAKRKVAVDLRAIGTTTEHFGVVQARLGCFSMVLSEEGDNAKQL